MQKHKLLVIAIIIVSVAIVVSGVGFAVYFFSDKTESYRSIQVHDLDGSAEIEREGSKKINVVENLYLESGDRVETADESYMRLKLDDDKYIMVEEESVLSIKATGNKTDSKTSIYLEKGTITNEIQNKLNKNSYYEVETPNAVMAVRGTIFRVEVYFDENGDIYTKLSVFSGRVTVHLVYPDGTAGKEVVIEEGQEVIIHSNSKISEYLFEPSDIKYPDFKLQTLYVLRDLMDEGERIVGITRKELEELIHKLENEDNPEPSTKPEPDPTEEPTTKPESDPTKEPTTKPGSDSTKEPTTKPESDPTKEPTRKPESDSTKEPTTKPDSDSTKEPTTKPGSETTKKPSTKPEPDPTKEPSTKPEPDPTEKPSTKPEPDPTKEPSTKPEPDPTEKPTTKPDSQKVEHTVTFIYDGKVIGRQKVEDGQNAIQPILKPADNGKWDFDFSQAIKKDITIEFK